MFVKCVYDVMQRYRNYVLAKPTATKAKYVPNTTPKPRFTTVTSETYIVPTSERCHAYIFLVVKNVPVDVFAHAQ